MFLRDRPAVREAERVAFGGEVDRGRNWRCRRFWPGPTRPSRPPVTGRPDVTVTSGCAGHRVPAAGIAADAVDDDKVAWPTLRACFGDALGDDL